MTAHLLLPYNWVDCNEPENCEEHNHLPEDAETLNNYPVSWIEGLLGDCKINPSFISFFNNNGVLHRENGPAEEYSDGTKEWYFNGVLHRVDGPARENRRTRKKYWFLNGKHHRADGPAIIRDDGEYWYQHGILHRVDGPAVTKADGTEEWYFNGEYHRENGPAIEWPDGIKQWYLNGVRQPDDWSKS